MTEKKYDNLLKVSFAVLAVSAVMLCISGYNLYFRGSKATASGNAASGIQAIRDSLQQVYSVTVKKLDESFNTALNSADTLSSDLDVKLAEFNKLRSDITTILKDQSPDPDFGTAKTKISELRLKVDALRIKNVDVEAENIKLQALLKELIANSRGTEQAAVRSDIKEVSERSYSSSAGKTVLVSDLHLFAVTTANNKEKQTNTANDAEKIIASFSLKNTAEKTVTELMVVVLQPDGKVIRNSMWESGIFETDEGKKVYSRKIFFDPAANDKQMNISLNPDRFLKGQYTMQVWYNGNMLAQMSRVLS